MLTATAISLVVTIGLLGAAPLVVAGADPAHQVLSHLFFLGYSQLPEPRLLYPAWSLDIEMRFYIVAPLLVFFMNRHGALALALLVSAALTLLFAPRLVHCFCAADDLIEVLLIEDDGLVFDPTGAEVADEGAQVVVGRQLELLAELFGDF